LTRWQDDRVTDADGHRARTPLDLERTIFFSDAVIAIALTLLALELPLPEGATTGEVWRSFVQHLGREYLSFVISFVVIGAFWLQHHRFFGRIDRMSTPLTMMNLASLFAIVLVPFATRLLSASESGSHRPSMSTTRWGPSCTPSSCSSGVRRTSPWSCSPGARACGARTRGRTRPHG
jgi:hypothetical protein